MRKQGHPVMSSGNHAATRGGCPVPRPPPAPLQLRARRSHLSVPVTRGLPMLTKPLSTLHSRSSSAHPVGSLSVPTGGDSGQFTVSSSPTCPLSSSSLLFRKLTAASFDLHHLIFIFLLCFSFLPLKASPSLGAMAHRGETLQILLSDSPQPQLGRGQNPGLLLSTHSYPIHYPQTPWSGSLWMPSNLRYSVVQRVSDLEFLGV